MGKDSQCQGQGEQRSQHRWLSDWHLAGALARDSPMVFLGRPLLHFSGGAPAVGSAVSEDPSSCSSPLSVAAAEVLGDHPGDHPAGHWSGCWAVVWAARLSLMTPTSWPKRSTIWPIRLSMVLSSRRSSQPSSRAWPVCPWACSYAPRTLEMLARALVPVSSRCCPPVALTLDLLCRTCGVATRRTR